MHFIFVCHFEVYILLFVCVSYCVLPFVEICEKWLYFQVISNLQLLFLVKISLDTDNFLWTTTLRNKLTRRCFPNICSLNRFESRVNRYLYYIYLHNMHLLRPHTHTRIATFYPEGFLGILLSEHLVKKKAFKLQMLKQPIFLVSWVLTYNYRMNSS